MANDARPSPQYSRMPGIGSVQARTAARATRTQRLAELLLFVLSGGMVALGAFAIYATGTASHNAVPEKVEAGLRGDRINVLFLTTEPQARLGRRTVAAASLSLLSIRPSTRDAVLIGLPVHLWADLGTHGHRPLGAAFEVGNAAGSPGGGNGLTIAAVERLTGLPVHGYVRVSTGELARVIDGNGGIDVRVPRGVYEARENERFPRGMLPLDGRRATLYGFSARMTGFAADPAFRHERAQSVIASSLRHVLAASARIDSNLGPEEVTTLRRLVDSSPLRQRDLTPHLARTRKTTAVYEGDAWVPVQNGLPLKHAAAAALTAAH